MLKYLVVLTAVSTMGSPVLAQSTQNQSQTQAQAQPTQPGKPVMVKKRVCEQIDENPYSRLGSRKVCKTVEVPATGSEATQQAPASSDPKVN